MPEFKASNQIPYILLAKDVRDTVERIRKDSDTGRAPWLHKTLPSKDTDEDVLSTPLCPEVCFERMSDDRTSMHALEADPSGGTGSGIAALSHSRLY
jgi:hypothetical protein